MDAVSFTTLSFRVVPAMGGGSEVQLTTIVTQADARALAAALAWHRAKEFLAPAVEDAAQVLRLRALVTLLDQVEALAAIEGGGPLALGEPQVALLTEVTATYVAERDTEAFQPLPERERLAQLRALTDPLFDLVAHFAGAVAEARAEHGVA